MGKLTEVTIQPGLFTLQTDRGSKNRWKTGNHVRFFRGAPQKLGGWVKASNSSFMGICRGVRDWLSLAQRAIIGFGTNIKLYVFDDGTFYDITPIRTSGTFGNNPITTINASALVTIAHTAHGAIAGDYVTIAAATAVGGLTIAGSYVITSITDADHYKITAESAATSGATGGGNVATYAYEISVGDTSTTLGLGWGAGTWGLSVYGTARAGTTIVGQPRTWSLDNWGEDLIACPRGGAIYVWDTSTGTGTRATAISGSPATAKAIMVSEEDRHLIVLGAHDGSVMDPLLVRWSDSEDYSEFTASATTDAGRKRLDSGNEIYCGIKVGKEMLIMTDTAMTSMVFSGPPYTFDFTPKGLTGGLAGPRAAVSFDGKGWWMGAKDFFQYDGRIRVVPCDVRNYVFEDFNASQKVKVTASANSTFGEVWWTYPSANSTECDRYVIYNVWENHWSFGTIDRSAMVANSDVFDPYGFSSDGFLYSHESGVNDNTSALSSTLSSWDMEIGDGNDLMFLSHLIPDFKTLVGSVGLTVRGKKFPHSADVQSEVATAITPTTEKISPRLRCRQISLTFSTSGVDDDFRMGTHRIDIQPDGTQ